MYNTFLNGLLPLFHSDLTYPHHHLSFGIHLVWPFSFLLVPISNYSKSTLQQIFRYDLLPEVTSNCQKCWCHFSSTLFLLLTYMQLCSLSCKTLFFLLAKLVIKVCFANSITQILKNF